MESLFPARLQADKFLRVDCPLDRFDRAKASGGKIGIVIGQQNSEHFRTVQDVDKFYALGQRVSQLTYNDNLIGGGSTGPKNVGLTPYGAQVVDRMNQLGMAVDVSHCSDRTALDAIEASRKPVLVTHSNCRALVPGSARCRTDEAIRKLAAKGGVIGVTMVRGFVGAGGSVTIENFLDHIDHVVNLAGIEHAGIPGERCRSRWAGPRGDVFPGNTTSTVSSTAGRSSTSPGRLDSQELQPREHRAHSSGREFSAGAV